MDPEREHDDDQAWYWTDAWQEAEREADEDWEAGHYDTWSDVEEMIIEMSMAGDESHE